MVVPSITNSSGVKFTFNEGDVHSVNVRIITSLDFDSMPGSAPDAAMLYDLNGVMKTITVSGEIQDTGNNVLTSGTAITIDSQRQWLESLIDGFQNGSTFISNYSSTYNGSSFSNSKVLIANISFNEDNNKPNILPFSITMNVGDV